MATCIKIFHLLVMATCIKIFHLLVMATINHVIEQMVYQNIKLKQIEYYKKQNTLKLVITTGTVRPEGQIRLFVT